MSSVLRAALAIAIAVSGVVLTAILAINAQHANGWVDYAKALVAILVTARLLLWLRQDRAVQQAPATTASAGRNMKMIAIGLVIGLGAPFVLLWLMTSGSR